MTPSASKTVTRYVPPWAEKTVLAVERWQLGPFHPLTCGNDSRHDPLIPKVLDGQAVKAVILICVDCAYAQSWIPPTVLQDWPASVEPAQG